MTKKQEKIPDRVYPRDLHGILQGLWDNKPFFRGWPNVELPSKAVFDEIIDVCYHASMLTEEGRPTVFRIVFLDSQSPVSPSDDELPPVARYLLSRGRQMDCVNEFWSIPPIGTLPSKMIAN